MIPAVQVALFLQRCFHSACALAVGRQQGAAGWRQERRLDVVAFDRETLKAYAVTMVAARGEN